MIIDLSVAVIAVAFVALTVYLLLLFGRLTNPFRRLVRR